MLGCILVWNAWRELTWVGISNFRGKGRKLEINFGNIVVDKRKRLGILMDCRLEKPIDGPGFLVGYG